MINEYYQERLKLLGLTEEKNKRIIYRDGIPATVPIFHPDKERDALVIPYTSPTGEYCQCLQGKKVIDFERIRFRIPQRIQNKKGESKTIKYWQPPKSDVYTYLPPAIVDKYIKVEKVRTLYVIEGEFKAIAGSLLDLDFIGIGGIFNFKDKQKNEIDEYLKNIIEKLEVKNIVIVQDADCRTIKYEAEKDLAERLKSFSTAVANFVELLRPFDVNCYFCHVDEKYLQTAKGLDDLLALDGIDKEKVRQELEMFTTGQKEMFQCITLNGSVQDRLKKHFWLDGVSKFYEQYKSIIQERAFIYQGRSYYWDGVKVVNAWYKEATSYLRIGTDFYKKVWIKSSHKNKKDQKPSLELLRWKISEITRDFNGNKNAIDYIPKFDSFINLPCNTHLYRRIIEVEHDGHKSQFYNLYNPLEHDITPGSWPNIELFLKHIFDSENTSGENLYEFGLDWLQLCCYDPTQKIPVLCVVSRERNTGKSTFLHFLKLIFKENAAILDNERFTGKFTSHFVYKLIVGIDEGFIPVEQKLMKERIKNYSTGFTIWLEGKGTDAMEIDNHIHLIMCSNDEKNFMQIDDGENRFAVLKVKKLEYDNPNMLADMEKEIPHFIHYLSNRKLKYEQGKSRFSFYPKVYETAALIAVQERTLNVSWQAIKEYIRNYFEDFGFSNIYLSIKDIIEGVNNQSSRIKISERNVKDYIEDELGYKKKKTQRYKVYYLTECIEVENPSTTSISKLGRPFEFAMNDWLTEEEIKDLKEFNSPPSESDIEREDDQVYERELDFYENYEPNPVEEKTPGFPENILQ